uniref:L-aspartate dehydrogenase n=1 Tax=uncultured marine thaumarchaeote KM3_34_B07 TaxID=1456128 RepID=A0A075H1G8_9ARCH|nr:putative dinucleotide-utilizing enzyme (nadX) [uncultured marine thaumarchaeote KM3_34_B07]
MNAQLKSPLKVGIGGLGAIGLALARRLDQGIDGLTLTAVSARDKDAARLRLSGLRQQVPVMALSELAPVSDVVVECVPAAVFNQVAEPAIRMGKILIPVSVGGLLENWHLVELARATGARINVPSGAVLGLDAVRAAGLGDIQQVTIVTRKPPASLAGAPHIENYQIDLNSIDQPLKVFEGSAGDGVAAFPANVNVAAALGLAGIGPDQTWLEVWADPTVSRNTHFITVESDSARFELKIENVPTDENPRTGRIVALSTLAALKRLVDPLTVGT